MKKILTTLVTLTVLATTLSADFIRVEAGAGVWGQTKDKGYVYIKDNDSEVEAEYVSNKDDEIGIYAWAYIKHFVPFIPNLRLEYSEITDNGKSNGSFYGTLDIDNVQTDIDIKQFEFIPYYNILDNTFWITLDLGLDLKILDIDYYTHLSKEKIKAQTAMGSIPIGNLLPDYSDSIQLPVPMLYGRARAELPISNLGAEIVIKYISISDMGDLKKIDISDINIKVDYTFEITPFIQPGFEIGYRQFIIDTEVSGDTEMITDFQFSGVYAGLMVRF